jgi:hypothetical protein
MPDTLLSMFPNLDDLLSLPPEELGRVILEIASGVMQNGMFNMAGLLAPLFRPVGKQPLRDRFKALFRNYVANAPKGKIDLNQGHGFLLRASASSASRRH